MAVPIWIVNQADRFVVNRYVPTTINESSPCSLMASSLLLLPQTSVLSSTWSTISPMSSSARRTWRCPTVARTVTRRPRWAPCRTPPPNTSSCRTSSVPRHPHRPPSSSSRQPWWHPAPSTGRWCPARPPWDRWKAWWEVSPWWTVCPGWLTPTPTWAPIWWTRFSSSSLELSKQEAPTR